MPREGLSLRRNRGHNRFNLGAAGHDSALAEGLAQVPTQLAQFENVNVRRTIDQIVVHAKNHRARQRLVAQHLVFEVARMLLDFDGARVGQQIQKLKVAGIAVIESPDVWAKLQSQKRQCTRSSQHIRFKNVFDLAFGVIGNNPEDFAMRPSYVSRRSLQSLRNLLSPQIASMATVERERIKRSFNLNLPCFATESRLERSQDEVAEIFSNAERQRKDHSLPQESKIGAGLTAFPLWMAMTYSHSAFAAMICFIHFSPRFPKK